MTEKNSTIESKDCKVVFSKEVLEYFESIKTKENSEWINKYFEVLSDPSNFNAKKYNIHHIRPCFTFKDENHKNRKETEPLANAMNGNKIKLSIYNHIKAHNILRQLFLNNNDARYSVYISIGKTFENLEEDEINKIAMIIQDCSKENKTKEDIKNYRIKYRKENHEYIIKHDRERYKKNKIKRLAKSKEYRNKNRDKIAKCSKLYYKNNRDKILQKKSEHYKKNRNSILAKQLNYYTNNKTDILTRQHDYYKNNREKIQEYEHLYRKNNKEKISYRKKIYRENNKEEISKQKKIYYENNRDKILVKQKEYEMTNRDKIAKRREKYDNQMCIDPIKEKPCTLCALKARIKRHPELYININPLNCIKE